MMTEYIPLALSCTQYLEEMVTQDLRNLTKAKESCSMRLQRVSGCLIYQRTKIIERSSEILSIQK